MSAAWQDRRVAESTVQIRQRKLEETAQSEPESCRSGDRAYPKCLRRLWALYHRGKFAALDEQQQPNPLRDEVRRESARAREESCATRRERHRPRLALRARRPRRPLGGTSAIGRRCAGSPRTINPPTAPHPKPRTESWSGPT